MGMEPSKETESRQKEEERMREAYVQLKRDLEEESLEQIRRKQYEERFEQLRRKWDEEERLQRLEEEEQAKLQKEVVELACEKLQTEVKKYDDGMVAGWKEDIDTLLVFAGLFSAVVTAFLIESYQWLSVDDTVLLLTQISLQLNGTQTQLAPSAFTPDASSIRINCFWFLSLIFSLTSALFGLLCKQWLREHQRDVPTRTIGEDLALRQLRRDSFEKWGVASFLSALPILLELALVFFFAGVLDLLWSLQPIVFGICFTAISLSMGLYILTTILPTITIPRDQAHFIETRDEHYEYHRDFGQLTYQFICPYKSPQSWAIYKLLTTLSKPFLHFPSIDKFTKTHLRPLWDHIQAQSSSWSTFDLRVVRQFDQEVHTCGFTWDSFRVQIYELRALQWAVTMFRDSPSMTPYLENVLDALPRSVAIPAVLDRWDIAMWEAMVFPGKIGHYLRSPNGFPTLPKPITVTDDPPLHTQEGIKLLFQHRLWDAYPKQYSYAIDHSDRDLFLSIFEEEISSKVIEPSKTFRFPIPLPLATTLWLHKEPPLRKLGLRLLQHFIEGWRSSPGYNEERHDKERVAFVNGLAEHIWYLGSRSVLLTSKRGQEFIRFIHHEIINRRFYRDWPLWRDWGNAIQKVQEVVELPKGYFAPPPEYDEDPPPSFQPPLDSIRYSIDTISSQSNNPRDEDEARPHSPRTESIEISVDGNHGNTTSRVANLPASLSAGHESGVSSRGVVSPDTAPDSPTQATEEDMRVPSAPEGRRKPARYDYEEHATVGIQGTTDRSSSLDRGRRRLERDEGRGSNTMNDPNHLRLHQFRP